MIFPERMCKVRVFGLKKELPGNVRLLHEYGRGHLKDVHIAGLYSGQALEGYSETVASLIKAEGMISVLGKCRAGAGNGKRNGKNANGNLRAGKNGAEKLNMKKIEAIDSRVADIKNSHDMSCAEIKKISDETEYLKPFSKFGIDFSGLESANAEFHAFTLKAAKMDALNALSDRLGCALFTKHVDKQKVFAIVAVDKRRLGEFTQEIGKIAEPAQMPHVNVAKRLAALKAELKGAESKKSSLEHGLSSLAAKYSASLAEMKKTLETEKERAEAAMKFAGSREFTVIEFYMPEEEYAGFAEYAKKMGTTHIEAEGSNELSKGHEEIPVLLKNPGLIKPFEFITRFSALPSPRELDPSFAFTLLLPYIYGMMVGDFGYGIISLILAYVFIRISAPKGMLRSVATLWFLAALPTMIFGVIFDEYFGFSHHELLGKFGMNVHLYHGMERLINIEQLLALTLIVGAAVITLGFIFGAINAYMERHNKHAIAKLAWACTVVFGSLTVNAMFTNADFMAFGIATAVSILIVVATEGPIALIELPSVAGNILSFSRIMAVGLAGVVIAVILNEVAFPSPEKGLFALVLLPIFILGHLFNAFLAMFESIIQGGRLTVVEFSSKFFHGGGTEYKPFKINKEVE
ncbi:MAG: V-type ATPase 116kDa subunit family protein [Candidatus Diapherotrites archaeon]